MSLRITLLVALFAIALLVQAKEPKGNQASADGQNLFFQQIQPLLKQRCVGCHGEGKDLEGGLDLRTRAALLKGGDSGPALVLGNAGESLLIRAIEWRDEMKMPPQERNRLSRDEVEWFRRWINSGAPWPAVAAGESRGVTVATSGGLSPDWTNRSYQEADLWAYRPVRRVIIPAVADHPIDAFIRDKLKSKELKPTLEADPRTLIRRLSFDLLGLPPTPEEMEGFRQSAIRNPQSVIYRLVDRLLASPHYAEQMARHWLDVVRYADTSGFSNDFERPTAWRYRDYVVRSFAQDKPFDRFVVEQLAGDELDPDNPEMRIAVGFLRMGPWEHTGMSVAAVSRQQFLDDITHSVGVTFLGQGLRCAQCHDHKFDPVPTRDYYGIQAVFASAQFAEPEVPFLPCENVGNTKSEVARLQRLLDETRQFRAGLKEKSQAKVAEFLKEAGVTKITDLPKNKQSNMQFFGLSEQEKSLLKISEKRTAYLERELLRFEPLAFSVYSGPSNKYSSVNLRNPIPAKNQPNEDADPVHILLGGSLEAPGETVDPGVLSAVWKSNDVSSSSSTVPTSIEGRRLALARWVASPNNTLTARVIVNRVWQQHFGRGLVATANNFGRMGSKPTHPELLDWLANWFVEHDWSLKQLHRLIVTSATYRQASEPADAERLQQVDLKNELLSYYPPRRLAAEEIRDAMLAVTGELNPEFGGPGAFPEIHWEVALQPRHIMGSVAPAYQPSPTPQERNRRTLYAFRYRTLADPMLEVFNKPGADVSCEMRDTTTVTPQVLALFNGRQSYERAVALALRLKREAQTLDDQIDRVFRLLYGRSARKGEREACAQHIAKMTEHHRTHLTPRVELPMRVEREMIEELTGEAVRWQEELDRMPGYQRDRQMADVDIETRALAELCLVLFNSNEFLYVR